MLSHVRAITLDLDDTLWPVWPAIERAEQVLMAWLQEHAPATAAAHDRASLRALRNAIAHQHPDWAHDLSRIRRESIRQALADAGEDPALAEPAFEVFFDARQEVALYADVRPALSRLAARYPLVALTNGNAHLERIGLAPWFRGVVSAREFGLAKPHLAIFREAAARAGHALAEVLHVGDDAQLDVEGAVFAGMSAAWVRRPEHAQAAEPCVSPTVVVKDLLELCALLGA